MTRSTLAVAIGAVLLLFVVSTASAQPAAFEIELLAVDATGAPLEAEGLLVGPGGLRASFVTSKSGIYRRGGLPLGRYELSLSRAGFESYSTSFDAVRAERMRLEAELGVSAVASSVVVRALPGPLFGVPGSTAEITRQDLALSRPFSIKETLRRVSGIHVVDEDAFGLNLNIGLRGLAPRRSQRTLLLEDGAPIHLAPYGDPSAHYHPPPEILDGVEVLKGSGQIVHGPQTVGGVINMLTEAPPDRFRISVAGVAGNRDYRSGSVKIGGAWDRLSLLGHAVHREGAGVREGHRHEVSLAGLKGMLRLGRGQTLQLKGGYYQERSDTSEAGMSQQEYTANPLGNPFQNDRFELDRTSFQAVHGLQLHERVRLTTNVYYNKLDRTSYRQIDTAGDSMTAVAETGCVGDARTDYADFAALCGNKMRPRNYEVFGVDPRLDWRTRIFGVRSEGVAGVRLHQEWITRRRFNGFRPDARETDANVFFRDWNEIKVDAFPFFAQNTFSAGDWTFTPGLRVETIRLRNLALRKDNRPVDVEVADNQTVALPGFGLTYLGLPRSTFFTGVHRGYAPPRPDDNFDPTDSAFSPVSAERSTNYEIGLRSLPLRLLVLEATLFRTEFSNQIVPGESVGTPELTWANAGRTLNEGFEINARLEVDSLLPVGHGLFVSTAYTRLFTARFDSDQFRDGINVRGNRLPYAPGHLLVPAVNYRHRHGWSVQASVESIADQVSDNLNAREPAPDGMSGLIPGFSTFNFALNAPLPGRGLTLFVSGTNLADRRYIVSRVDGIHVGRPRQVMAGLRYER